MITKQPDSKTFVLLRVLRVLRGSSCPQLTWTIGRCLGSSTARRSTSSLTGAVWSQTPTNQDEDLTLPFGKFSTTVLRVP
jgi:hypothetical protein